LIGFKLLAEREVFVRREGLEREVLVRKDVSVDDVGSKDKESSYYFLL
jgi:hypothetical protein